MAQVRQGTYHEYPSLLKQPQHTCKCRMHIAGSLYLTQVFHGATHDIWIACMILAMCMGLSIITSSCSWQQGSLSPHTLQSWGSRCVVRRQIAETCTVSKCILGLTTTFSA